MAFVDDPNKKQQQNTMNTLQPGASDIQTQQTPSSGAAQPQQSGSSAPITTAPSPRQQQKPSTSGTFTNLQQYSKANQEGGARIAGSVQQSLQNQAKQGEARLGTTTTEFQQKMDRDSGQAATVQGRKQAIQDVRGFTEREAGVNAESALSEGFNEQAFKDIINKEYAGIERADQTKSYQDARNLYQNLERRIQQSQDPTQSASLLKDVYKQPGQQYTQGQRNLDALFYDTSKEAQAIRSGEPFQDIYKSPQQFTGLEQNLASQAQARREAINQMRGQARTAFEETAKTRTGQVEGRLGDVEQNWDNLANYFRDTLRGQTGNVLLSDVEAQTLGLRAGDQFFNQLTQDNINDFIKSTAFEKDRIVSKQEQQNLARLEALSNLGNLGYTNKFYNAERAGTQSSLDALDTENVRNKLNESIGQFANVAEQRTTGTGTGSSAYDKFNWDPKNMGWYSQGVGASAQQEGKLADVLRQSGYDFTQSGKEQVGTTDYLKKLARLDQDTVKGDLRDYFMNSDYLNQNLIGAATMADPQATLDTARNLISNIGSSAENISNSMTDAAKDAVDIFSNTNPVVGGTIAGIDKLTGIDLNKLTKNALEDVDYLYNPLAAIGGLNKMLTGSKADERRAQAEAQLRAYEAANRDLKNKMQQQLKTQGFYNVANIAQAPNEALNARADALRNLLKGLDKTNV